MNISNNIFTNLPTVSTRPGNVTRGTNGQSGSAQTHTRFFAGESSTLSNQAVVIQAQNQLGKDWGSLLGAAEPAIPLGPYTNWPEERRIDGPFTNWPEERRVGGPYTNWPEERRIDGPFTNWPEERRVGGPFTNWPEQRRIGGPFTNWPEERRIDGPFTNWPEQRRVGRATQVRA